MKTESGYREVETELTAELLLSWVNDPRKISEEYLKLLHSNTALAKIKNSYKRQFEKREVEYNGLLQGAEELEGKNTLLKNKNKNLRKQNDAQKIGAELLASENKELLCQKKTWKAKLDKIGQEKESLNGVIRKFKEASVERDKLNAQIDRYKHTVASMKKQFKEEAEDHSTQVGFLRGRLVALTENEKKITLKIKEIAEEKRVLKKTAGASIREADKRKKDYNNLHSDYAKLRGEYNTLKSSYKTSTSKCESLTKDLASSRIENENLLAKSHAQSKSQAMTAENITTLKQYIAELEKMNDIQKEQIDSLEWRISTFVQQDSELKNKTGVVIRDMGSLFSRQKEDGTEKIMLFDRSVSYKLQQEVYSLSPKPSSVSPKKFLDSFNSEGSYSDEKDNVELPLGVFFDALNSSPVSSKSPFLNYDLSSDDDSQEGKNTMSSDDGVEINGGGLNALS
jgi:hypothetical protein